MLSTVLFIEKISLKEERLPPIAWNRRYSYSRPCPIHAKAQDAPSLAFVQQKLSLRSDPAFPSHYISLTHPPPLPSLESATGFSRHRSCFPSLTSSTTDRDPPDPSSQLFIQSKLLSQHSGNLFSCLFLFCVTANMAFSNDDKGNGQCGHDHGAEGHKHGEHDHSSHANQPCPDKKDCATPDACCGSPGSCKK